MNHVYNLADVHLLQPSLVTIGVFDGVHLGHQFLIRKLVERARATNRLAVVLTFFPHPDIVLRNLQGRYYLTTADQRAALLTDLGVDCVVTHPFDENTRHMRAAEFVDLMVKYLKVGELWVGADFAMGYQREGNVAYLTEQGGTKDFTVQTVDLIQTEHADSVISSTAIRQAIEAGDVEQAKAWLGRGHTAVGKVIHGQARGRTIGFPTANIDVWDQQVLPANGVYAGWATVEGQRYMAVTNVGVRPTFNGDYITVEAFLMDFSRDIYDQMVSISFEKRLRGEQKFDGIQALIAQIRADAEAGRAYLETLSR